MAIWPTQCRRNCACGRMGQPGTKPRGAHHRAGHAVRPGAAADLRETGDERDRQADRDGRAGRGGRGPRNGRRAGGPRGLPQGEPHSRVQVPPRRQRQAGLGAAAQEPLCKKRRQAGPAGPRRRGPAAGQSPARLPAPAGKRPGVARSVSAAKGPADQRRGRGGHRRARQAARAALAAVAIAQRSVLHHGPGRPLPSSARVSHRQEPSRRVALRPGTGGCAPAPVATVSRQLSNLALLHGGVCARGPSRSRAVPRSDGGQRVVGRSLGNASAHRTCRTAGTVGVRDRGALGRIS